MELLIGRVVKSHGIRGEVVVDSTTDDPELRFAPSASLSGKQGNKELTLTIDTVRTHQGRLLIKFEEIPDRNAADSLRGTKFFAEPIYDESEGFYDHELEGLKVVLEGKVIGEVTGVTHAPAQDLLEVSVDGREVLIPFVEAIVPEIDLEAGTATITPPKGLLDL